MSSSPRPLPGQPSSKEAPCALAGPGYTRSRGAGPNRRTTPPPPDPNKKPRTGIHHQHYMFSLWAQDWGVNAFNLVAREKGLSGGIHNYIAISQNLPHVHLPIGPIAETPDDKGGQLMAMCDTGAGLNLGNLQYHTSCYKIAPSLVESYFGRIRPNHHWGSRRSKPRRFEPNSHHHLLPPL